MGDYMIKNDLIQDLINENEDYGLSVILKDLLDTSKKLNDENIVEKIINHFDKVKNKEEIWDLLLDYIEPGAINDVSFNYFLTNEISIIKLSHMELSDDFLKKLSDNSEEAYLTLAKRFFFNECYSVNEFIKLLMKCQYESVFLNIFLSEKTISYKGLIIHEIINNNILLSDEFKILSQRIRYAKHLYCTNNEKELKNAYENGDYIYMMAISQNIYTPDYVLKALSRINNIKYASRIRQKSTQTLRLKVSFHINQ